MGVLFLLMALWLVLHAIQCWRRTRLALMTSSMASGALVMAALAVASLSGSWSWPIQLALLPVALGGALMLHVESGRSPEKWRAWKERATGASLTEILTGQHIPDLLDVDEGPGASVETA